MLQIQLSTLGMSGQTHQLVKDFHIYQHTKINFITQLQRQCILGLFQYFRHAWPHPTEIMVIIKYQLQKPVTLIVQKINFIPHFSFEMLQRFYKLVFGVIWAVLALPSKINGISLEQILMFICVQTINFITPLFFEVLQRYYKLAILGISGMFGYNH